MVQIWILIIWITDGLMIGLNTLIKEKRLLTKDEMKIANNLWKKYHPSKNN